MKIKLLALASWIGLLVSALSEYGFDVDFPLTPPLWLLIAVCALLFATAHSAIGNRIHGIAKRQTGTYLSVNAPSPSNLATSMSNGNAATPTAPVAISPEVDIPANGVLAPQVLVCITANDTIPSAIFLSPPATRGPPSSDSQINRTLGRPAGLLSITPLLFETHVQDSSAVRNTFRNGIGPLLCAGLQTAHNVRRGRETGAEQHEEGDQT